MQRASDWQSTSSAAIGSKSALLGVAAPSYEERLLRDKELALEEASLFFEGKGAVKAALQKIASRLNEISVPYAVVGAMALNYHGYHRLTVDIDILVTREGLRTIHEKLEGLGYLPPFAGSKQLRDTEFGVNIEFLVTGEYPGDGKPKPVAFPAPAEVATAGGQIRYIKLPALLELKLASGMTGRGRRKDLSDVQEVIKALALSRDYAQNLHPYVRDQFLELWSEVQDGD